MGGPVVSPASRAKELLEKATPGLDLPVHEAGEQYGVRRPLPGEPVLAGLFRSPVDARDYARRRTAETGIQYEVVRVVAGLPDPGLLRELIEENERLREAAEINRVRYQDAERTLGDLVDACVLWRGATGEIPFECREAYAAARSALAWPFESKADRDLLASLEPNNPWPDHPVIDPDPAEVAQAEERARIEALAREEEERAKEDGRREQFEAALDLWENGAGPVQTRREYLGLTLEQWRRYRRTGEIPEGWEPPAELQEEGE